MRGRVIVDNEVGSDGTIIITKESNRESVENVIGIEASNLSISQVSQLESFISRSVSISLNSAHNTVSTQVQQSVDNSVSVDQGQRSQGNIESVDDISPAGKSDIT